MLFFDRFSSELKMKNKGGGVFVFLFLCFVSEHSFQATFILSEKRRKMERKREKEKDRVRDEDDLSKTKMTSSGRVFLLFSNKTEKSWETKLLYLTTLRKEISLIAPRRNRLNSEKRKRRRQKNEDEKERTKRVNQTRVSDLYDQVEIVAFAKVRFQTTRRRQHHSLVSYLPYFFSEQYFHLGVPIR